MNTVITLARTVKVTISRLRVVHLFTLGKRKQAGGNQLIVATLVHALWCTRSDLYCILYFVVPYADASRLSSYVR